VVGVFKGVARAVGATNPTRPVPVEDYRATSRGKSQVRFARPEVCKGA
jgi:hypothetical protein